MSFDSMASSFTAADVICATVSCPYKAWQFDLDCTISILFNTFKDALACTKALNIDIASLDVDIASLEWDFSMGDQAV